MSFRPGGPITNGCTVFVQPTFRTVALMDDSGQLKVGQTTLGNNKIFQNSQCSINAANVSVTSSGEILSVSVTPVFKPSFAGLQQVSAEGNDSKLTGTSGYVGTWTVPSSTTPPPTQPPPAPVVTISVAPATASVGAGQTKGFTASVTGSTNTGVTWSLSPAAGSISAAGVYTAPASIATQQNVTITATSAADSTKKATAVVTLVPTVTLSVAPASATLNAKQTKQFTASMSNGAAASIAWTLSPAAGSVSANGLYTAPSVVTSQQTVTLTATNTLDATKKSSAIITLMPLNISVGVSPQVITLLALQTQLFTATVSGASNPAVTWSISPAVGSITPAGVYTAPASVKSPQTVNVTATSTADSSKSAVARINLTTANKLLLPVEVIGPQGTTTEITVSMPDNYDGGPTKLWMQIHNVNYANKMSVQINNGAWTPVNEQTVTLPALSVKYGGFGGGFNTHKVTMAVPLGALTPGANTIRFKYNQSNGFSQGFRILKFDIVNGNGASFGVLNQFEQEDPDTWQPPINTAAAIAEGKRLFQSQPLVGRVPNNSSVVPIRAKCASCHSYDGRDLKYFNFSNAAIRSSSMAHGMTSEQGDMIASYIRSLPYPNPGRVWNPPYQPGPGMDSKPVVEWAAGAGIDAVLERDADTLDYIAPGGDMSKVSAGANLNAREVPIAVQLPDWLHWLPKFHPEDSWGDKFTNSELNKYDATLRSSLRANDPVSYRNAADMFKLWVPRLFEFLADKKEGPWTPDYASAVYGTAQWETMSLWTINQEFGLEPMAREIFGSQADERAWFSQMPFITSPNMLAIPREVGGIANGRPQTHTYFSFVWYQLQLILNNSNKQQDGNSPIDWGYSYGFISNMSYYNSAPQAGLEMLWMIKGLQILENGIGPERGAGGGWMFHVADPSRMVVPSARWSDVPTSRAASFAEAYLKSWFERVKSFSTSQWSQGGWVNGESLGRNNPDGSFGERVWYMIPRFRYMGVDPSLLNQITDWAKTVWPQTSWDQLKTSSCYRSNTVTVCSTD